ncbi:MAG: bifunctional DNA primase/polymerase [Lactobacillus sp.]|uniref:bifunctional DNA primase/polymerase n=1 Tax=Lactobacillus sp. TaxID=1591 RepID=UPI002648ABAF|nr:bifunctional DNA primase/polymerase [Lactobacillus sp.]MDN5955729.1 bifunctional DNA primase/polymerase [Lactobacillus sp.]MDN5989866.1 bifunctional DNA primase/polymerase [Lactobacillus sp.]MDN6009246.1 bifunctional DNA primase/polymerase [Lactobacillus sp.]
MHPNLVNYALSYAEHGFSVIPIGSNKRPLIKFANKPPLTNTEIRDVWKKYPTANIALKTDKFFVIDVDRHGGEVDGMKSIKKLGHDDWFKGTLTEQTAHNGFHFFFTKPSKVKIQQNIGFLDGVDLKAHENNYVVVAPSQLGDKQYKWLNSEPMKESPQGLIDLILEKQKEFKPVEKLEDYKPTGKTQTTKLFEQIINGLGPTGGRNNALASFIGGLLFRNVDPNVAAQLAGLANDNTDDSLPIQEVERTFNSMVEKEIRRREVDND